MMHFGITTFAGFATSVVTVAGLAMGSASAFAEPTVFYKGAGLSLVSSEAAGTALRNSFGSGVGQGDALATGNSKGSFYLQGIGLGEAAAYAKPTAYLNTQGTAVGQALPKGIAFKRSRVYPQIAAVGEAYGDGNTVVYSYGAGVPAVGSAIGIGTTWHVIRTAVFSEAIAIGDATRILGARQRAECEGIALASPQYQVGFAGLGVVEAIATGDAAVRVNGVLFYAGNGKATAHAIASLSRVSIYQPQRAVADSIGLGTVRYTRAFKGRAISSAVGRGDALVRLTGVSGVQGAVYAIGRGQAKRTVQAQGSGLVESTERNYSTGYFNGAGYAQAVAYGYGNSTKTVVVDSTQALSEALVTAVGIRSVVVAAVRGVGEALATGFNQVNDISKAPPERTLVVGILSREFSVTAEPRTVYV